MARRTLKPIACGISASGKTAKSQSTSVARLFACDLTEERHLMGLDAAFDFFFFAAAFASSCFTRSFTIR